MENTCGYSDNWQPYIGDYDKFEYDVKLIAGTLIENCYPNGGYFNQMSSDISVNENEVAEIRFSNTPISFLHNKFSQFKISDELIEKAERKRRGRKALNTLAIATSISSMAAQAAQDTFLIENKYSDYDWVNNLNMYPTESRSGGSEPTKYCTRWVDIRTEPKIGRNDVCPKCDSGKKFKKCCGKTI